MPVTRVAVSLSRSEALPLSGGEALLGGGEPLPLGGGASGYDGGDVARALVRWACLPIDAPAAAADSAGNVGGATPSDPCSSGDSSCSGLSSPLAHRTGSAASSCASEATGADDVGSVTGPRPRLPSFQGLGGWNLQHVNGLGTMYTCPSR